MKSNNTLIKSTVGILTGIFFSFGLWYIFSNIFTLPQYLPAAIVLGLIPVYFLKSTAKINPIFVNDSLLGAMLFVCAVALIKVISYYSEIQPWDFPSFYLFAKVGQNGGNFYDPELFSIIYEQIQIESFVDSYFVPQLVQVGFVYPPPTMLFLLPFASFDVNTAFFLWQSVLTFFWAVDIYLLYIIYKNSCHTNTLHNFEFYAIALIILTFPGLTDALFYSQTNSVLLFLLLLTIIYSENRIGGIFLSLMIVIKPISALFFLYFLVSKKWAVLKYAILTGLLVLLLTGIVFGFDIFINYFTSLPTTRIPDAMYSESINKSLQAVLLRFFDANQFLVHSVAFKATLLVTLITLLFVLVIISIRLSSRFLNLAFVAFIPWALIAYPATLIHYGMFLLPLLVLLYSVLQSKLPYFLVLLLFLVLQTLSVNLFYLNICIMIILFYVGYFDELNQFIIRTLKSIIPINTFNKLNIFINK